jgi:hypothetical protein
MRGTVNSMQQRAKVAAMVGVVSFENYLLAAASTGVAIYSLWSAYKAWRDNRLVADTAVSRIRSAAQGYVQLAGRALPMPRGQSHAPLTGLQCAWWRYEITDRKSEDYETIDGGTSELPFLLDDDTGRCVVDPRGANVFPTAKIVWYGDSKWPLVRLPKGEGFAGKLIDALMPKGRYRYTEYRLVPEERICVLGAFRSPGGAGVRDPEDAAAAILHDWKKDQNTLLGRFDRDRDGRLSVEEWDEARKCAREEAMVARMAHPPEPPDLSVLSQPEDGRAFLLSASDSESLAGRLRHQAAAAIMWCIASAAAVATAVWAAERL